MTNTPPFLASMLRQPGAAHVLRNERTGDVLADTVEGAFDSRARRRGLLGRDGLPLGHALVIAPCNSIHTFFMRFPIDVLFVRKDGEVVKISRAVPAWRLRAAPRAFAVIECAAGTLPSSAVAVGDRVIVGATHTT